MKHVLYNIGDGVLEIIIRDETGSKIEHFKMNLKDKKTQRKIFIRLKQKYGIGFPVSDTGMEKEGFFDF